MFAIVETGGKQIRVEEGLRIDVERLDAEVGAELTLEKVLLVNAEGDVKVGQPYVDTAKVTCEVLEQKRGPKIVVFKKRRRQDSRVKTGHRQEITTLKVKTISV